ncbi:MAG: cupin domain-containing protein [Actinomycetota bacterium]
MVIRDLAAGDAFPAGDGCRLRELFHPEKELLDVEYSFAEAVVDPGEGTYRHRLREASEVYYILEGEGLMHIGDEAEPVRPYQAVYIPPGAIQFIENTGDIPLRFICIVEPGWREYDEEVF